MHYHEGKKGKIEKTGNGRQTELHVGDFARLGSCEALPMLVHRPEDADLELQGTWA